ncbi:DUF6266 family protein [Parapedobacter koreensis]|uniref:Uncharacterized protein n=1 Tax=Parapedobacter koreensis TaxID=332977 RepID=A0A1H7JVW0_9SPHI|nr:DUF6266 family protein [Parapedobacter koreensis]SEK77877.1 hypothetical protein SAMN05421740_102669 [Parapedobacter koreensis]
MAILKNGPNGGFSGKVGSIVGYQWRGKDVIRGLPRFSSKPRTPDQLANQLKMTLTQRFLQRVIQFIRVGFRHEADRRVMSAFNVAMSYNKKQAIVGEYPDLAFDYRKALVSMGSVPPVKDGTARWVDGGLELQWTNDTGEGNAGGRDYLLAVLFFPDDEVCEFRFNGASRTEGRDVIAVRPMFVGKPVHVYASFTCYNGSDISPSSYVDVITV